MPDEASKLTITDPRAMRALAHPTRMALMEVLAAEGSATATRCAEVLGESQASCSFHLRQLAKYGFVEEADSEDRRERPWRLVSIQQNLSNIQPDVPSAVAADQLDRVFAQRDADRMLRWIDTHHDEPEEWQRAAFSSTAMLPLTTAELDELGRRIGELIKPYVSRIEDPASRPDGARWAYVSAKGFPMTPGQFRE